MKNNKTQDDLYLLGIKNTNLILKKIIEKKGKKLARAYANEIHEKYDRRQFNLLKKKEFSSSAYVRGCAMASGYHHFTGGFLNE